MATPEIEAPPALRITRTFPATREKVFRAWTDREALKRWFAPSAEFTTEVPEFDLRVGGRFRIVMKGPDGKLHIAHGVFREVRPPEKLVLTWAWESEPAMGDSLLTLEFSARDRSTELTLIHEGLPSEESRQQHEHGWSGCLGQLGSFLS